MGGELLQLLRVMRLKETLDECVASKLFLEMKEFHFLSPVIKSDDYWDCLFAMNQTFYGLYRLLRLADTKTGGNDKVKFYLHQIDRLLPDLLANLVAKLRASDDIIGKLREANRHKVKKRGQPAKGKAKIEEEGEFICSNRLLNEN